jgi:outer membrane protein assembly factor BamB
VTTFGGRADRTGRVDAGPDPANLRPAWTSPELDGQIYASPLVFGDRVIVATEGNTVFALDAASGRLFWQQTLGPPVPQSMLPCGNIDPTGITGTPVIDPASRTVYLVDFLLPGDHELVALNVETGAVRFRRPIDPAGFSPLVEQQRAALTIANGKVYVAFGGLYGDCGAYRGAVVAVALDGSGDPLTWLVPTKREGGLWAPSGPAVDAAGNLFVAVGNGESTDPATFDYGNAVVRLTPELALADYWAPSDFAALSAADQDLGSIGPVLLGPQLFVAGKSGTGYVLNMAQLGGVGHEVASASVCRGAAFGGAAATPDGFVVVGCNGGPAGVRVGTDGSLGVAWHGPTGRTGAPVIAGTTAWLVQNNGHLLGLSIGDGTVAADFNLGAKIAGFPTPALTPSAVYAPVGAQVAAFAS